MGELHTDDRLVRRSLCVLQWHTGIQFCVSVAVTGVIAGSHQAVTAGVVVHVTRQGCGMSVVAR